MVCFLSVVSFHSVRGQYPQVESWFECRRAAEQAAGWRYVGGQRSEVGGRRASRLGPPTSALRPLRYDLELLALSWQQHLFQVDCLFCPTLRVLLLSCFMRDHRRMEKEPAIAGPFGKRPVNFQPGFGQLA